LKFTVAINTVSYVISFKILLVFKEVIFVQKSGVKS